MNWNKLGSKEVHHGRTTAAWASSLLAVVGFIIGTVGFLIGPDGFPSIHVPTAAVGGALIVLAPIMGGILNLAGQGQDG